MRPRTYTYKRMWAKGAGKDEKGGRIQPSVLLNFRGHPRSQHCSLSSAGVLQGHHFSALSLFFLSEDKHIWKALFIQGNEMPTWFSLTFFIVVWFFFKYKFLWCFFCVWWLPATWSALTFHVCSLAMLSPLFCFLSGICGLLTCELYGLLFIFPLCDIIAELYKYKNVMWWIALLPHCRGIFVAVVFFQCSDLFIKKCKYK